MAIAARPPSRCWPRATHTVGGFDTSLGGTPSCRRPFPVRATSDAREAAAWNDRPVGEYLDLGTQRVYYEEHGSGFPLFLLHGGGVGADSWQAQVPAFAAEYHVFVPERRGHGRTPDVPGPWTTENMAAETA